MEGFSRDMLETASEASRYPTLDENGRMIRHEGSRVLRCTKRQKRC